MQEIQRLAELSVARGCGFAALAIFTVMVGLSFEPALAFRAGAALTTLLLCVLALRAARAPAEDHRRTELWVLLPKSVRPAEPYAQRLIATARRDAYLRYARFSAGAAAALWGTAIVGSLIA